MFDQEHVSATSFYRNHYSRISGWLSELANAHQASKMHGEVASHRDIIRICNEMINETLVLMGNNRSLLPADGNLRSFITSAEQVCDALRGVGLNDASDKIDTLMGVIVNSAGASDTLGPSAGSINITQCSECANNIVRVVAEQFLNAFSWPRQDPRQATSFFTPSDCSCKPPSHTQDLLISAKKLQGWCSEDKAMLLYSLIREHKPTKILEIGIFGGRSIIPMAAAAKDNRNGSVVGIETWSPAAATTYRTSILNDFWWSNVDFKSIKGDFLRFLVDHDLHDIVQIIEAPSDKCSGLFDSIDFLHIDGGHSTYGAAQDVVLYASKVPSGGVIVFDDINWSSTSAALEVLMDSCQLISVTSVSEAEQTPGCAAFLKV